MTKGAATGLTANRASLGSITGCLHPGVGQRLAFGGTAFRAGLGCLTGGGVPGVIVNVIIPSGKGGTDIAENLFQFVIICQGFGAVAHYGSIRGAGDDHNQGPGHGIATVHQKVIVKGDVIAVRIVIIDSVAGIGGIGILEVFQVAVVAGIGIYSNYVEQGILQPRGVVQIFHQELTVFAEGGEENQQGHAVFGNVIGEAVAGSNGVRLVDFYEGGCSGGNRFYPGFAAGQAGEGDCTVCIEGGLQGDIALVPGVSQCLIGGNAATAAATGLCAGSTCPIVTQCGSFGNAAELAELGLQAGGIHPIMVDGTTLCCTAAVAGFWCFAGSIHPVVISGAAFGQTTFKAGLGGCAGGIHPIVAQRSAFCLATIGAGSGGFTSSFDPVVGVAFQLQGEGAANTQNTDGDGLVAAFVGIVAGAIGRCQGQPAIAVVVAQNSHKPHIVNGGAGLDGEVFGNIHADGNVAGCISEQLFTVAVLFADTHMAKVGGENVLTMAFTVHPCVHHGCGSMETVSNIFTGIPVRNSQFVQHGVAAGAIGTGMIKKLHDFRGANICGLLQDTCGGEGLQTLGKPLQVGQTEHFQLKLGDGHGILSRGRFSHIPPGSANVAGAVGIVIVDMTGGVSIRDAAAGAGFGGGAGGIGPVMLPAAALESAIQTDERIPACAFVPVMFGITGQNVICGAGNGLGAECTTPVNGAVVVAFCDHHMVVVNFQNDDTVGVIVDPQNIAHPDVFDGNIGHDAAAAQIAEGCIAEDKGKSGAAVAAGENAAVPGVKIVIGPVHSFGILIF